MRTSRTVFRVEFHNSAERAIRFELPPGSAAGVEEMFRSIGETAAGIEHEGMLGGESKLDLSLKTADFEWFYTLDLANRRIVVFAALPLMNAVG